MIASGLMVACSEREPRLACATTLISCEERRRAALPIASFKARCRPQVARSRHRRCGPRIVSKPFEASASVVAVGTTTEAHAFQECWKEHLSWVSRRRWAKATAGGGSFLYTRT